MIFKELRYRDLIAAAVLVAGFASCDDSLEAGMPNAEVTVNVALPEGIEAEELTEARYTFKNISNGQTKEFGDGETMNMLPGLYDISYEAKHKLENGLEATLRAVKTSVTLTEGENRVTLEPFQTLSSDDFVISEIFFTGTLQSSGNPYNGDDYIRIYNNTDHIIYADGLTFFESKYLTTQKFDFTPDIMSEAMTVDALYTIPGNGTEHPVQPGEYVLLADTGIDHRTINPNSFDLSGADWEWYDISTKPSSMDIDSPTVPNLDKWYCYTLSFFILHNRGFKAYGLARIPIDKETYLKDYLYTYDYTMVLEAGTFPMTQTAYRLPNEWIVDVVNCSVESNWVWNVCDPSLDMGWTYCGKIDKDKTRFGKAVIRKEAGKAADGRVILQDTNNSSEDFIPEARPSLMSSE